MKTATYVDFFSVSMSSVVNKQFKTTLKSLANLKNAIQRKDFYLNVLSTQEPNIHLKGR